MSAQPVRKRIKAPDSNSDQTVSLYCVNGLLGGATDWLGAVLPDFAQQTNIEIDYVEEHSRMTAHMVMTERAKPKADVVITLPPFIHMLVEEGLLAPFRPEAADKLLPIDVDGSDRYSVLMRNYPNLICHHSVADGARLSYLDLLEDRFKGKVQYSKPGWSGAGTAFLLQVYNAFGGKTEAFAFLQKLQKNCVVQSSHTQGLEDKINGAEIFAANGDLQTNYPQLADFPNQRVVFPAGPDGTRSVFEFSYYIGLTSYAPNPENGEKLINYLLSEAAQSKATTAGFGLPVRSDILPNDENFKSINDILEGVETWQPDWRKIARTLDEDVAEYESILPATLGVAR